MGIYITPANDDARLVVEDCRIEETDEEGIRIAVGVDYVITHNVFESVSIQFDPYDDD